MQSYNLGLDLVDVSDVGCEPEDVAVVVDVGSGRS